MILETQLKDILCGNRYPGRGIVIGLTPDGKRAACAYFIMGRSRNSQNRIFKADGDSLRTEAFDPSLVEDPRLIIYRALCPLGRQTLVANGDQSETVLEAMAQGETFAEALKRRTYEPDAPHYTPRITGLITPENGGLTYDLSILKKEIGSEACERVFWHYDAPKKGVGHFISTYDHDGDPLPTFSASPKAVAVFDDMKAWADSLWDGLDDSYRISLVTRFIDLTTGEYEQCIINKHQQ